MQLGGGAFYPVGVAQRRGTLDAVGDSSMIFTGDSMAHSLRAMRRENDRAVAETGRY